MILPLGSLVLRAFLGASCQEEAAAAEEPIVLQLPAEWEAGTRYDLVLRKERVDHENGVLKLRSASTTPIEVEVLEKTETGYSVRWTFGATAVEGAEALPADFARELAELLDGVVLEFATDECGAVQRLTNREVAQAHLEKTLTFAESQLREKLESHAKRVRTNAAIAEVRRLFAGPGMEAALLREAMIFYVPSGGSFALKSEQTYETQLPNPLGGDPFPAKGCFLLEDFDLDVDAAIVVWTQVLDPERVAAVLEDTVKKLALRMGDKADDLKITELSIEDRARFDYVLSTGIPRKVEFARTVVMNERRRVDSFVIDVKPPKAAAR